MSCISNSAIVTKGCVGDFLTRQESENCSLFVDECEYLSVSFFPY